jgi:hypothetical protein
VAAAADKDSFWRKGVSVHYIIYIRSIHERRRAVVVWSNGFYLARRRLKVMRSGVRGDRAQL